VEHLSACVPLITFSIIYRHSLLFNKAQLTVDLLTTLRLLCFYASDKNVSWNPWHLSHKCPQRAIFCAIECASLAGTIGRATLPSSLARPVWYAISPKSSYNTGNIMATTTFIIILHTHTSTHVYINTHAGSLSTCIKKLLPIKSHSVSPHPLHLTSSTLPLSSPSIYNTIHLLPLPLSLFHHFCSCFDTSFFLDGETTNLVNTTSHAQVQELIPDLDL
jgi:hypothetical protein